MIHNHLVKDFSKENVNRLPLSTNIRSKSFQATTTFTIRVSQYGKNISSMFFSEKMIDGA